MMIGGNGNNPLSPPWVSGRYYFAPNILGSATSSTLGVGTMRATAFYVPNTISITKIGSEVTSAGDAGSKFRLGIYADDGTGRPSILLADAGTIAGDSVAVQEATLSTPISIGPGWYWAAGVVQVVNTTQPTVRTQSGGILPLDAGPTIPISAMTAWGFGATSITGALPATFPSPSSIGSVPRIFVKT